jgi:Tfp pilus assembly protein PilE
MKNSPHTLIRSRHRQALWTPAVWTAIGGLGLLFALGIWWPPADPGRHLARWGEGLAVIALVAALVRLRSPHSASTIACALDRELVTHNRIEAATELAHRQDALAVAQHDDTAAALSARRLPPAWPWPAGLALLLALVLAHLSLITISGYHMAVARAKAAQAAAALAQAAQAKIAQEKLANEKPPAAILSWISPKPETTATPIEEVPLSAEANSATGLKSLALVVTVNGEPRPEVPLPADVAAGRQPIELSIYLDELGVQPYDMVTYYLHAQRVVPAGAAPATPWPVVTSPLQFLQVRPLRDDTRLANGGGPPPPPGPSADDLLNFVKRLKVAQIQLMRDTFALANDTPPHTDPAWPGLNQATGSAQTALGTKTQQAIDLSLSSNAPIAIINLIMQAQGQMTSAASALAKPDPAAAAPDQGRALANLTAVEKYYIKIIAQGQGQQTAQTAPDPFKVDQPFKLPPREQTPAGQLEQLARDQAALADQLAGSSSSPGSGAGSGSGSPTLADTTAQQQKLAEAMSKLASAGSLPADATPALQAAAAAGKESVNKLIAGDPGAAAEPAARAAAQLRDAIARVDAAGKSDSAAILAQAQQALNQSATQVAGATPDATKTAATDAATRTADAMAALRNAATQQQTKGSAPAASQLADLANAIATSQVQDDLKKLADSASASTDQERQTVARKLTDLAQGAANGQGAIGDRDALAAQALDALRRDRANLDRASRAGQEALLGLHDDVLTQAENALAAGQSAAPSAAQSPQLGNKGGGGQGDTKRTDDPVLGPIVMLTPPPPPPDNDQRPPFMRMMGSQIDALINVLTAQEASTRPQVLTTGQASEAPPAYRPAVADYFESLAHEQAPTPAQP